MEDLNEIQVTPFPVLGMKLRLFNPVAALLMAIPLGAGIAVALLYTHWIPLVIGGGVGLFFYLSPRVADQWERAVVLRLGRFSRISGPGLFFVFPFFERIAYWIDHRVRTTGFMAEKTLTMDTVPVDVDAVLFWRVFATEKAALEVEHYGEAVSWAAQTALRDVIGKTLLADMLVGRERIDEELKQMIDQRTHAWGVEVQSVEIRDVVIPTALEDAMSRQAQAVREKDARVILGDAEMEIAEKFTAAADHYAGKDIALHLRAMNMLYEGLKEKGALMVVPSTAVESMGLGHIAGLAALGMGKKVPQIDASKDPS
ncbi:MAG: slipin family protein [Planctomycetota bacterium]|jgi:regulator of protease activity HflC (stomatin/prohibitin superfamily)